MAARREPTWADIPAMMPTTPAARELEGIGAIVAILDRMPSHERGRALRYLADRFGLFAEIVDEIVDEIVEAP